MGTVSRRRVQGRADPTCTGSCVFATIVVSTKLQVLTGSYWPYRAWASATKPCDLFLPIIRMRICMQRLSCVPARGRTGRGSSPRPRSGRATGHHDHCQTRRGGRGAPSRGRCARGCTGGLRWRAPQHVARCGAERDHREAAHDADLRLALEAEHAVVLLGLILVLSLSQCRVCVNSGIKLYW